MIHQIQPKHNHKRILYVLLYKRYYIFHSLYFNKKRCMGLSAFIHTLPTASKTYSLIFIRKYTNVNSPIQVICVLFVNNVMFIYTFVGFWERRGERVIRVIPTYIPNHITHYILIIYYGNNRISKRLTRDAQHTLDMVEPTCNKYVVTFLAHAIFPAHYVR
jgi:hypothetical protein